MSLAHCLIAAGQLWIYPVDGTDPFIVMQLQKPPAHEFVITTDHHGEQRVFEIFQHQLRMGSEEWIEDCVNNYSAGHGDDIDIYEEGQ